MERDAARRRLVRNIGRVIGYGTIMHYAEECWRDELKMQGIEGGELTVGPCASFMVACPHPMVDPNDHCIVCCGSGRITEGVKLLISRVGN